MCAAPGRQGYSLLRGGEESCWLLSCKGSNLVCSMSRM